MSTSSSNAHATLEIPPRSLPGFSERRLKIFVRDHRLMHVADEVGATPLRRFEERKTGNVHRMFTGFADEEHRIGRRDQLHRRDGTHPGCASCKV